MFFRWLLIISMVAAASAASGATALEAGIVRELNLARTNPQKYAQYVKDFRQRFRGTYYTLPGSRTRIVTTEGVAAVDEAIRFLSRQKRLSPVTRSTGLAKAAADLAKEQKRSGAVGHVGKKSGDMEKRIDRHGTWHGTIGEIISYGPDEPRLVVMQLIIDDGVQDRGHRSNIFDPRFRQAGAACAAHPTLRTVCVIDLAGDFSD